MVGRQFERMIGLVKAALNKKIGNGFLEEVRLVIDLAVNNCPLSYVEENVQLPLLTLNSMLFLNSNILPELQSHRIEEGDLRKRA